MSAELDALQAATAQLGAFLEETKKSNVRIIHGADVGAVNHVTLTPTPAVTAWSDDLVVIAHVADVNTEPTPDLQLSSLPAIPITMPDGAALLAGDLAGVCCFKIESVGGGFAARLLYLAPAAVLARQSQLWTPLPGGDSLKLTATLPFFDVAVPADAFALQIDVWNRGALGDDRGIGMRVKLVGSSTFVEAGYQSIFDGAISTASGASTHVSNAMPVGYSADRLPDLRTHARSILDLGETGIKPYLNSRGGGSIEGVGALSSGMVIAPAAGRVERLRFLGCTTVGNVTGDPLRAGTRISIVQIKN